MVSFYIILRHFFEVSGIRLKCEKVGRDGDIMGRSDGKEYSI